MSSGEIHEINDLITFNLNIRQFAEDVISTCEGPELLRAFYAAISSITVLDPTCGSGAFLFAALNILEPLYEACLVRMEAFLEDLGHSGEKHRPEKFSDFRRVLAEIDKHPNRRYFILKSIIINNLYGVDIMEEAVEICKLRLFLKLVAQVERVKDLEPLPDIDFNIRPGNTLVGFARLDDVKATLDGKFGFKKGQVDQITEDAEIVDRAYRRFHEMQTAYDMNARDFAGAKQELRARLAHLSDQLDRYLATEYGISESIIPDEKKYEKAFQQWSSSHQPFHWFAEFNRIMNQGGFDVAIGNPPYVIYSSSKLGYSIEPMNYSTISTKNLYAYIFERSVHLVTRNSPVGLIVQLSALSSEKMSPLQKTLEARGRLFAVPFPRRPESMFDGVEMPVAILLSFHTGKKAYITARVGRIYTEERQAALQTCVFKTHQLVRDGHRIAKLASKQEESIFRKVERRPAILGRLCAGNSENVTYYQEACRYWVKATAGLPYFKRNGQPIVPPHGRILYLKSAEDVSLATCLMNSSLFFWWYTILSDCEHVNDELVRNMRLPDESGEGPWSALYGKLAESLERNSVKKIIRTKQGHTIEYEEMTASLSKNLIDDIDVALARSYGFTDEELDFIINYDIKYRMGQDSGEGEGE
jgi:hypothetical protein